MITLDGYLSNPAMQEIFIDAKERIEKGEPLSQVHRVVLREWVTLATARACELVLKSVNGVLSDEEKAEQCALTHEVGLLRDYRP